MNDVQKHMEAGDQMPVNPVSAPRAGKLAIGLATAAAALNLLTASPAAAQGDSVTRDQSAELSSGGEKGEISPELINAVKEHLKQISFSQKEFVINKKAVSVSFNAASNTLSIVVTNNEKLTYQEEVGLYQKLLKLEK